MMKRLTMLMVVCVFLLMPTAAGADDGGWLDFLYRMDMKLVGVGTDIHLLCLNKEKNAIRCEELFKIPRLFGFRATDPINFEEIKHEIDFRFGFYWKYGQRFADVPDPPDAAVHAWKLMTMYHYHVNPSLSIGGGSGYMVFYGDGFNLFSRGIITPVSVTVYPWKGLTIRPQLSYIMQGLSGANFGDSRTSFSNRGEWNGSIAIGYDFRRKSSASEPRP
jgi:hypothetical protein